MQCHENLTFCCKCSMLEIYNEVITDLINPAGTNLQIREDIKRGCYVEDLSEHTIQNGKSALTHCSRPGVKHAMRVVQGRKATGVITTTTTTRILDLLPTGLGLQKLGALTGDALPCCRLL